MKTLIFLDVPKDASRIIEFVNKSLGAEAMDYHTTFGAKCCEQMVEQIITGFLRDKEGIWCVRKGNFPEEGSYFFGRIMAEVDCLLKVGHDLSSGNLYLQVIKARLTSLQSGDRFIIPREAGIGSLFKPYNFAGPMYAAG